MTGGDKVLLAERQDAVLRLTINRPDARNALSEQVILALTDALAGACGDRGLGAVVLTGAGDRAFCAGGDLKPDSGTFGFDYSMPNVAFADLLRTAARCTLPLIARINGHCVAGGMGLLAMCDMAVTSSRAKFGLPEVRIGLFPMQVAALLQHLMPPRKFAELCITGETIGAEEALAFGLVNHVVEPEELDAKVEWLLAHTLDKSPTAIRLGKYALRQMAEMNREQALAYAESQIGTMVMTEDAREGMKAFLEKRPPSWTGR